MIDINFNLSGSTEILQNLYVMLNTPAGSIVFDRDFGINQSILDLPINQAKASMSAEIIRKIPLYEPSVRVKEITFTNIIDGQIKPKVVIEYV